jgi:glycosyltransferase involved in cell wall biosynthesis
MTPFCRCEERLHSVVMISVVIPTLNSQASLSRCLESLVGAAMSGLVREVIVADGGSGDDTLGIADGAGARVVEAGKTRSERLIKGADTARGDWLLFLHPETALEPRWDEEAVNFVASSILEKPRAAVFRFALNDKSSKARRIEARVAFRSWLFGGATGEQGLLIPTRFYRKLGGYRPLDAMEDIDLIRRIGRRRLVPLHSRAINEAPKGIEEQNIFSALRKIITSDRGRPARI